MKAKKDEELQSRREFFKKAAKAALPILGAVVLASNPVLSKAAEADPMGCSSDSCSYTCATSCARECRGGCSGTCKTSCGGGCQGGCRNGCYTGSK